MASAPTFENLVEMFERTIQLYGPRELLGTREGASWEWTSRAKVLRGGWAALAAFSTLGVACGAPSPGARAAPDVAIADAGSAAASLATDPLVVLVSRQAPSGLVVRGGWVYWIDGERAIWRVPARGGKPIVVAEAQDEERGITAIAVDDANVYFTTFGGHVEKVPLAGGARTTLASDQERPGAIVVRGDEIFWADDPKVLRGSPRGRIMKAGAGGPPTVLASDVSIEGGPAVSGTTVYFSTTTAVLRVPASGGPATVFADGWKSPGATRAQPAWMVADASGVFWTNMLFDSHGLMNECDVVTSTSVTRVSGAPTGIAADATHVYVTTTEVGSGGAKTALFRVARGGGAPTRVTELADITSVGLDESSIYLATTRGGHEGKILRMPK